MISIPDYTHNFKRYYKEEIEQEAKSLNTPEQIKVLIRRLTVDWSLLPQEYSQHLAKQVPRLVSGGEVAREGDVQRNVLSLAFGKKMVTDYLDVLPSDKHQFVDEVLAVCSEYGMINSPSVTHQKSFSRHDSQKNSQNLFATLHCWKNDLINNRPRKENFDQILSNVSDSASKQYLLSKWIGQLAPPQYPTYCRNGVYSKRYSEHRQTSSFEISSFDIDNKSGNSRSKSLKTKTDEYFGAVLSDSEEQKINILLAMDTQAALSEIALSDNASIAWRWLDILAADYFQSAISQDPINRQDLANILNTKKSELPWTKFKFFVMTLFWKGSKPEAISNAFSQLQQLGKSGFVEAGTALYLYGIFTSSSPSDQLLRPALHGKSPLAEFLHQVQQGSSFTAHAKQTMLYMTALRLVVPLNTPTSRGSFDVLFERIRQGDDAVVPYLKQIATNRQQVSSHDINLLESSLEDALESNIGFSFVREANALLSKLYLAKNDVKKAEEAMERAMLRRDIVATSAIVSRCLSHKEARMGDTSATPATKASEWKHNKVKCLTMLYSFISPKNKDEQRAQEKMNEVYRQLNNAEFMTGVIGAAAGFFCGPVAYFFFSGQPVLAAGAFCAGVVGGVVGGYYIGRTIGQSSQ